LVSSVANPDDASTAPSNRGAGFIATMNGFSGSGLFLLGIILFTVGALVEVVSSFPGWNTTWSDVFSSFTEGTFTTLLSYSAWGVFAAILPILVVIAFWLIYVASKDSKQPGLASPALMLIKINLNFFLVALCLIAVALLLVSLFVAFGYRLPGLFMLACSGIYVAVLVCYFSSVLSVVDDVRYGVSNNILKSLRGVPMLRALIYISAGFALLLAIGQVAMGGATALGESVGGFLNDKLANKLMPTWEGNFVGVLQAFLDTKPLFGAMPAALIPLVKNAGAVLLIIVLSQFNIKLKSLEK
jgi:hypothetical protein